MHDAELLYGVPFDPPLYIPPVLPLILPLLQNEKSGLRVATRSWASSKNIALSLYTQYRQTAPLGKGGRRGALYIYMSYPCPHPRSNLLSPAALRPPFAPPFSLALPSPLLSIPIQLPHAEVHEKQGETAIGGQAPAPVAAPLALHVFTLGTNEAEFEAQTERDSNETSVKKYLSVVIGERGEGEWRIILCWLSLVSSPTLPLE